MWELLKTGSRSMDPPSSSRESSKIRSEPKRIYISDEDSEAASTLGIDSPLSDSSLEDDSKKKKSSRREVLYPQDSCLNSLVEAPDLKPVVFVLSVSEGQLYIL
ncbi:hypothetical protein MATL_G00176190 [Megalops atlanticus]|uniref:Uncharacterized protein n=1 Tax=Megalops atlanticus TaxID=7932 RepID=A0A9D3PLI2_MEGAT|nr:hypothetical protein MATL_G00176190 [Megalops atlanticus]